MPQARTIQIFLPEGNPKSSKIVDYTGPYSEKLLFCSRKNLEFLKKRKEADNTGIYFLFGSNEDNKPIAYIGEAEKLFTRYKHHLDKKEWFNYVVFFTLKDNSLNKAHAKFLEHYCIEQAEKIGRYELENKKGSSKPNISEQEFADMENMFNHLRLLMTTAGFPIFEPLSTGKTKYYFNTKGIQAKGEYTDEGFKVLKGSECAREYSKSANDNLKRRRQELIKKDILKDKGDKLEFTEDCLFSSPSTAGTVVAARHVNGWTVWKTKQGKTLDEMERK